MPDQSDEISDIKARLSAVESRVEIAIADASAARHLSAARDRDLADLTVKVDAVRSALNAHGVQTAARFDRLETRMDRLEDKVDRGFTEIRGRLDQTTASHQQLAGMLTVLIDRGEFR